VPDEMPLEVPNPTTPFLNGPLDFIREIRKDWYLVKNLVRRDLKGKYNRASIGFGWIVLEPLLLSAVYYVLFTMIADRPEPNYSLFVIIGIIIWGNFGKSLQATIECLSKNGNLIKQVYFPRSIIALSPVLSQLWISMISLVAVIPVMWYLGVVPNQSIWMLPVALILTSMMALGIGLIFAPLNVLSQDVSHLFRFIVRAGFFISPVMWTYEMMIERAPAGWVDLIMLNPVVVPITFARHGLDGTPLNFELFHLLYSIGFALVVLIVGMALFKRWESRVVKYL